MKLVSVLFRKVATNNIIRKSDPNLMAAWQISKYGVEKCLLECSRDVAIPAIKKPDDILIEIKAASLNALDLRMKVHGKNAFNNKNSYINCSLKKESKEH
uniref:Uncharacterized protein n=1 Tax=Romanomermis culicivorax TaxID=13658 RepID=A0A915HZH6_ROMCU